MLKYNGIMKYIIRNKSEGTEEFLHVEEKLKSIGVEIRTGEELVLVFDEDKFNNARKRNAGRVSLGLKYQGGYGKIPLAEIKARMKEIGAAAVAKELGVSRRTLYYRIKEAEENGFDEIV